ncbi:hypothetical protein SDC9_166244 [bioreactor metagenome]|uniref:Uncharacterized protein n=1 Tax=bioreactor metagenome TaxID=1076179 RepID=A0A645FZ23_9ZZZZ
MLKGFIKYVYAPCCIASTEVSIVPYAVIIMTTISGSLFFIFLSKSIPLSFPSLRSSRQRSIFSLLSIFNALLEFVADFTSYFEFNANSKDVHIPISSSIIRMVFFMLHALLNPKSIGILKIFLCIHPFCSRWTLFRCFFLRSAWRYTCPIRFHSILWSRMVPCNF